MLHPRRRLQGAARYQQSWGPEIRDLLGDADLTMCGGSLLRFKGSSQHRLIRDVTVADIGKQVLLALLGCSSLVRLLPERRLGQGSAVAEPRSGAQHP